MFGMLRLSGQMIRPGDVIYAQRANYQHYGIYAGKSRVIHFVGEKGDWWANVLVRETSIKQFSKGDSVFLCRFPKAAGFLYSRYATLRRAKSELGAAGFNLVFNNCEHFSRWCKTGRRTSAQVRKVMHSLAGERLKPKDLLDDIGCNILDAVEKAAEGIYNLSDRIDELGEKAMNRLETSSLVQDAIDRLIKRNLAVKVMDGLDVFSDCVNELNERVFAGLSELSKLGRK
jgi:hypothetical protein